MKNNNRFLVFIMTLLLATTTLFGANVQPANIIKSVEVHFIDTGNSDAILIKDNGKNMLIDGAENDDEKSLVDYLKAQEIKKLDYIVLTHPDADHCGALDAVIKNFDIGTVLIGNGSADTKTYKDFVQAAIDKKLQPSVPLEDKVFTLGNGTFQFYNTKSQAKDVNDRSLVMFYKNGEHEFLFTGDAGKDVEKSILEKMVDIDVLKVGHHGSNTSTSQEFLDKIKPEVAIITCGKDNKYGHPHKDVSERLKSIKTYRTDLNGNIVITTDGKTLTTSTQKVDGKATQVSTVTKIDTITNTTISNTPVVTKPITSADSTVVYITKTGKKYHKGTCKTLKSKIESTVKEAKAKGLTACQVCLP
ncbi:ComEC/Rec2 family competence protein [Niameybacter massiliensis]|uniref:ComEC/Rec2 family competence protein n=1 Tax=Holtiella tumoricola TaxID=3018743 RepID=A0AA42DJ91_9FIRM|nr:ComEC/Rec2 family competence protein [Holtiella tumoricola]MDA3729938.1 ComEC/Rec2 family competence protein [Holtiella tumoricola]